MLLERVPGKQTYLHVKGDKCLACDMSYSGVRVNVCRER